MGQYKVKGPDGRTYNVTAPDGTSQEEILARVKAHAEKAPRSTKDTAAGLAGNYLDGILPGAAGGVRGLREVALNALQAPFSTSEDFEPVKSYNRGVAFQEARQQAASAAHPTTANIASGAGIAAGMLLPAAKIAKGATLAQKSLAGAKTAGSYSALSGLLSSKEDGLLGKAGDAISSGLSGAAVGLAMPSVMRGASALASPLKPLVDPALRAAGKGMQTVGQYLPGAAGRFIASEGRQLARDPIQAAANQQMGRAIHAMPNEAAGRPMRPSEVAQEVQRRHAIGVPAIPADLGDSVRGRFAKAARTPGPALASVRNAIDERKQGEAARTAGHIAASLGPVGNVERQAEELSREGLAAAGPLYEQAYAQAIPATSELLDLFSRPAGRQAMQHASIALQNEGISPFTQGLIEGADGAWEAGQVPTMQAYDYAKTALDDIAFAGRSPFATPEGVRDRRGAIAMHRRLLEIMDGEGSGPRINVPAQQEAPRGSIPPAFANLPKPPPNLGTGRLPVLGDTPGPWTGQRLHPENGASSGGGRASAIPPEGLNPYWKPAREAYAGPVQNRKALKLGEEMARADAVDAANRMEGMTGSQVDHFRLGHRSGLADYAQAAPDYGDAARRVAGSAEKRTAIETVHGQDTAQALYDRLGPEQDASRTWKAVRPSHGDQAPNIGDQDRQIEEAARGVFQTLTGRPGEGAKSILQSLARGERGGPEVHRRIAEVLGNMDPKAVEAAMREIENEEARRALVGQRSGQATQRASRFLGEILGTNLTAPVSDQPAY